MSDTGTPWWVYVLMSTKRNRTYVGCTTDVARRLSQHNGDIPGGAKYTRTGRPWILGQTYGPFPDRGTAQTMEARVKRLRGIKRLYWSSVTAP